MDAAKAVDELTLRDKKPKPEGDEEEDHGEEKVVEQINHAVEMQLKHSSRAKRGDYKDGMVYQARKAVIEEFMQTALASSKKCQRKHCGAYVPQYQPQNHTHALEAQHIPSEKKVIRKSSSMT